MSFAFIHMTDKQSNSQRERVSVFVCHDWIVCVDEHMRVLCVLMGSRACVHRGLQRWPTSDYYCWQNILLRSLSLTNQLWHTDTEEHASAETTAPHTHTHSISNMKKWAGELMCLVLKHHIYIQHEESCWGLVVLVKSVITSAPSHVIKREWFLRSRVCVCVLLLLY